ncbi:hypothetical protein NVR49_21245 [Enterobacter roggenkampii]|uniref:hypothetical protein n=1 Tax=Enterobacter roggenkampii TaxID=1812935 RepID=UPI00254F8971|nr:hypothetical protein [Enterobacter roggenkampii]MDL0009111.1 hypothetical protein [Enterobacter roggenkampii]
METEHLFFGGLFGFALAIVIGMSACSFNNNATLERMVKAGANPVAAYCAVNGMTESNREACTAIAKAAPQ